MEEKKDGMISDKEDHYHASTTVVGNHNQSSIMISYRGMTFGPIQVSRGYTLQQLKENELATHSVSDRSVSYDPPTY